MIGRGGLHDAGLRHARVHVVGDARELAQQGAVHRRAGVEVLVPVRGAQVRVHARHEQVQLPHHHAAVVRAARDAEQSGEAAGVRVGREVHLLRHEQHRDHLDAPHDVALHVLLAVQDVCEEEQDGLAI